METGISVYPGLGGTIQEKTARIERAAALGMTRLFTSFHIPETDPAAFRKELQAVLETARQFQFDIVADVSSLGSLPGHGPVRPGSHRQTGHYDCPL